MRKRIDPLQQFVDLRTALHQELTGIRSRLRELDAALGGEIPVPFVKEDANPSVTSSNAIPSRNAKRLTMREAVALVTANGSLTMAEIVQAMKSLGYKFKTKNPRNSVGAFLYGPGKKDFKGVAGRFAAR